MKKKFIFDLNKSTLSSRLVGAKISMYTLGNSKLLLSTLMKEAWRISALSMTKVKGLSSRVRIFNNFMQYMFKVFKHHGASFSVKLLKANSVAIQRYIAGTPYNSLRELEPTLPLPRLYQGIPSVIPKVDRVSIREGHKGVIRFWLSLFNVYRILIAPLAPKLNSITDPIKGPCSQVDDFKQFISEKFWHIIPGTKLSDIKTSATYIFRTQKASPNVSNARMAYFTDLCWWAQSVEDFEIFKQYCLVSKSYSLFNKFNRGITLLGNLLEAGARIPVKGSFSYDSSVDGECASTKAPLQPGQRKASSYGFVNPNSLNTPLRGGQLSLKVEPAGKVRIFAIVDIWTQSVLSPLHDSLFNLLRKLPNDGTFDQNRSFERAMEKATLYNNAFSIDLSSATDRLPIFLQAHILDVLTQTPGFGKAWSELLVSRGYTFPRQPDDEQFEGINLPWNEELKYAVGQPMGALSSWAMLALTHHCIVQYAANKAGVRTLTPWCDAYEILGDDLVIFDERIAKEYTKFMNDIGVDTNPAKSIFAPEKPVCEFAKRTSYGLNDVSGLSWKELLQGNNLPGKINLVLRLGERSLISSQTLLKVVLVRFGNELYKPLKQGVGHSLIGILGSLLDKLDKKTLIPALALLVSPALRSGEEDYIPKNVSIPMFQAVQVIMKLLNSKQLDYDWSSLISHYEDRVDFVKAEILPFASQSSYLKSLERMKQIVSSYDHKITILSSMLIDCSRVQDKVLKAQIRSIAEDILLRDTDPQDVYDKLYNECYKAAKYGMTLARALEIEAQVEAYERIFELRFDRPKGEIPVDNRLAVMASRAGEYSFKGNTAIPEFGGYPELGLHKKDWLVQLTAPISKRRRR